MIEKLAETDRKDEIAEDGVVQTRKQKRSSVLIGHGKQQSAENTEGHGQPVSENNVHKTEGQRAGQNHQEAVAKKRLITVKEKGPVEKHDQKPEIRSTLGQREEQLGGKDAHGQSQKDEEDGVTHQQRQELGTGVVPRSEMSEIKRGIAAKHQKGREGSKHEIRDGKVGQQAVIDEQGKADE